MNNIIIVDSMPGSGKTSWAINYMNDNTDKRFIYITPYLDEVDRVIKGCIDRSFESPKVERGHGSKLEDFNRLLSLGKNIVSTHALFSMVNDETLKWLKENEYILILDEVFSVIEDIKITKSDKNLLLEKFVSIDEEGKLTWTDETYFGSLTKYRKQIENGDVYLLEENNFIVWTFPVKIMEALQETYILTYLFRGQLQRYYYDMNNIQYEYKSVEKINDNYVLCKYREVDDLSTIRQLINICDNKNLNRIGTSRDKRKQNLSKTWYEKECKRKSDSFDVISKNMVNYFQNICKGKSEENMWTVFKDYKSKCKGRGYSKGFVSCNARATNEYKHKKNLAYMVNIFNNPMILKFFSSKGVSIEQDVYALSELIQWIWRSRIREGLEINIYIPSERMRNLLTEWLDEKIIFKIS